MAVTFRGVTANPADNGTLSDATGNITLDKDTGVLASAVQGDLIAVLIVQRDGNPTITVGTTGGQTWSSQALNSPGSSVSGQVFWCTFTGTWAADPVFSTTANFGGAITGVPMVFVPNGGTSSTWAIDVSQSIGNATPTTPFDVTATGHTVLTAPGVTIAYWFNTNSTATTWSLQSPGSWANPNSETQWRNTQGTDISVSAAYKINSATGATGNITNRQATATGITTYWGVITWKEVPGASPPTFSVSPTVTSQTANAYTLGYTPSASSTFYVAAVPAGASTPSAAQIKAGTGGGIVAAASEAITGADSTTISLASVSPLFPKYKLCALLNNAGGDSSIVTLDNEFLDPPTGKQFQVFDVPLSGTAVESLVDASPAIVDGDIWVVDLETTPGAYDITLTDDGDFDVDVGGDTSRQAFTHDVYDNSLQAYYGSAIVYVGNHPPFLLGDPTELAIYAFDLDTAIDPIDLTVHADDEDGDIPIPEALDALPGTLDIDEDGILNGTSGNVQDIFQVNHRWVDVAGDAVEGIITYIVGDVTVPNVVGMGESEGLLAISDAYLLGQVTSRVASSELAGTILSQDPAADAEAAPNSQISLTVSDGPGEFTPVKFKIITQNQRRRRRH